MSRVHLAKEGLLVDLGSGCHSTLLNWKSLPLDFTIPLQGLTRSPHKLPGTVIYFHLVDLPPALMNACTGRVYLTTGSSDGIGVL